MSATITAQPIKIYRTVTSFRRWYFTSFALILFIIGLLSFQIVAKGITNQDSFLVSLTNDTRAEYRLTPLKSNQKLEEAAKLKAQDMFKNQYFEHISPSGSTPWQFIKQSGYNYTVAGENLAIDFTDLNATHNAWLMSPAHRANILDKRFQEIGIASISGQFQGRQTIITVEMFGTSQTGSVFNEIKGLW